MSRFLAFVKKAWANRTVERLVWTLAEFAVGYATARWSGSVVAGVSAGTVFLLAKEYVIARLATL